MAERAPLTTPGIEPRGTLALLRGAMLAEMVTLAIGVGLILFAATADRAWLDRHLLPHLFLQRRQQLLWWAVERSLCFLTGLALALPIRRHVGQVVRAGRGIDLLLNLGLAAAAVPLALFASELVLRSANWARVERWATSEEPLRQADPLLGWANVPSRRGSEQFHGRAIHYFLDERGRRIAASEAQLDPARPSILFAGESIMFGFRLNWRESLAGRLQATTGLQSVNIAVNGYGADQELMRLRQELPRFRRPAAVIALFTPALLERSLDRHRPHLDGRLDWHRAEPAWRLERVFKNLLLYHSTARIEEAVVAAHNSLAAIVADTRRRGAVPIILVPEFIPEHATERALRERVLTGLPHIRVELDPGWSLPGDGHPDAQANDAMAEAVRRMLLTNAGRQIFPRR